MGSAAPKTRRAAEGAGSKGGGSNFSFENMGLDIDSPRTAMGMGGGGGGGGLGDKQGSPNVPALNFNRPSRMRVAFDGAGGGDDGAVSDLHAGAQAR